MANLRKGSSGEEVKQLQTALGFTGKDVDGIFGSKTEAAVKSYQQNNGLTVDGIAGKNTLGKLYSTNTATPVSNTGSQNNAGDNANVGTTASGFTYDKFDYDPYANSDTVNDAFGVVDDLKANAPGDWTDPYLDKYMGYLNQYENRDPFSYDFNSDALYQQYRDQYIQQGQLAMMDAMGQAAAMSGGYGNSYAQTAGQQAYNQQLSQLNNIMPELYQMAYDRYNQEGQRMLDMYNAYMGLSDKSYGQYQDSVNRYYQDLGNAQDYAFGLQDMEYNTWQGNTNMAYNVWNTETGMNFDDYQTLKNQQFQAEEAQKDRDFQASENAKSRAASAAKAVKESPYGKLNTEDTQIWIKKFEGATSLAELERYTTALEGIIGPEAAAQWYDTYATKFEEKKGSNLTVDPIGQYAVKKTTGGGSGAGVSYTMVK